MNTSSVRVRRVWICLCVTVESVRGVDPGDSVYVSGLPLDCTEEQVSKYFGGIGIIAKDKKNDNADKIKLYKDASGALKGDGVVTYQDPEAAKAAVGWFSGQPFMGSVLKVELAFAGNQQQEPDHANGGGNRGAFGGHSGSYRNDARPAQNHGYDGTSNNYSGSQGARAPPASRDPDWGCVYALIVKCWLC